MQELEKSRAVRARVRDDQRCEVREATRKPNSIFCEHSTRSGHPRRLRPNSRTINQIVLESWWAKTVGALQCFASDETESTNWHIHERSKGSKSKMLPSSAVGHANKQCSHPICSAWAEAGHDGSVSQGFRSGEAAGQRYANIGKLAWSCANCGTSRRTSSHRQRP